jgi:hypothetical protein
MLFRCLCREEKILLRTVDEWKIRPEQADNHWLDGIVGCAVAAAIQGCVLFGMKNPNARSIATRVKLSALKRTRGQAGSS